MEIGGSHDLLRGVALSALHIDGDQAVVAGLDAGGSLGVSLSGENRQDSRKNKNDEGCATQAHLRIVLAVGMCRNCTNQAAARSAANSFFDRLRGIAEDRA